jgi:hypothetical protein
VPAHPESVTGKALRTMRHRRWNRPGAATAGD